MLFWSSDYCVLWQAIKLYTCRTLMYQTVTTQFVGGSIGCWVLDLLYTHAVQAVPCPEATATILMGTRSLCKCQMCESMVPLVLSWITIAAVNSWLSIDLCMELEIVRIWITSTRLCHVWVVTSSVRWEHWQISYLYCTFTGTLILP